MTLEELAAELRSQNALLETTGGQIAKALREQEEIKKQLGTWECPPELARKFAALEGNYDNIQKSIGDLQKEVIAKIIGDVEAVAKRADDLERAAQRPNSGFPAPGEMKKSLGQSVVELIEANRDLFLRWQGKQAKDRELPVHVVKGFDSEPAFLGITPQEVRRMAEVRKALSSAAVPVNALALQIPGYLGIPTRRLRMRDLMPVVNTTYPVIRYLRQRGFMSATASAVTSITLVSTTATVTQTAHGYRTGDIVLIAGAVETGYNGYKRITVTGANTYTFKTTAGQTTPATGTITARRANNYGAAAFVAEGGLKPEADMTWDEVTASVQVIAHYIKANRQILEDLPGLRNDIDGQLLYGLRRVEDGALLYGTGAGSQIQGAMTLIDTQTYAWSEGMGPGDPGAPPADTKADAIRRARTRIELADGEASGAIIHPQVWEEIELAKGTDAHYIWGTSPAPGASPEGEAIWRVPLVVTPQITYDSFLIADFSQAAIYDREEAGIRFSDSDQDDFIRNRVTVLAEERLAAIWKRPEWMVIGTFDSAPT